MQCPRCQAGNEDGSRFCESCGAALVRPCPTCGHGLKREAKFCGTCGAPVTAAPPAPSAPLPRPSTRLVPAEIAAGERRQLTLLFSDLVGSTELSTQLDPEEWRDRIAQYQRVASDAVNRFGGTVARYVGDGVLALFGYPRAHEDDAERTVRAGLAIVEGVAGADTEQAEPHGRLRVRVGIHTGLTVIGEAGGQLDVFGETPNVAARVQGAAGRGDLIYGWFTQGSDTRDLQDAKALLDELAA